MSIGKKILSAFVEMTPPDPSATGSTVANIAPAPVSNKEHPAPMTADNRFSEYFEKLFDEANIPGPDYYEFSKMVGAMQIIPDELSRFAAAFAGLQVQGLSKDKLLATAAEYLKALDADAGHFSSTVAAALQEKVQDKRKEAEEKSARILDLSREIAQLQTEIGALQDSIRENEEKIESRQNAYLAESRQRKSRISEDMEKIKQYIH